MKKNLILLILIICIGGTYTAVSDFYSKPKLSAQTKTAYKKNLEQAPDFIWEDLNGNEFKLSDLKGKVVVINFWATWCAPCVVEFPQMVNLAKIKNDNMVILFLSVDGEKDVIKKFIQKHAPSLPLSNVYIGWDKDKDISLSLFGTKKYPETYILTPSHKIFEKIIGADVKWDGKDMQDKIDSVFKVRN